MNGAECTSELCPVAWPLVCVELLIGYHGLLGRVYGGTSGDISRSAGSLTVVERRLSYSCVCPEGPIQTAKGSTQHDNMEVCCKFIGQFSRSALCGNELCLLSVACCSCPGSQHCRRAKQQAELLHIALWKRMQRKQGPSCCTLA